MTASKDWRVAAENAINEVAQGLDGLEEIVFREPPHPGDAEVAEAMQRVRTLAVDLISTLRHSPIWAELQELRGELFPPVPVTNGGSHAEL